MRIPESTQKPIGLILPDQRDLDLFYALNAEQKGYVLHYMRSNWNKWPSMQKMARKAKEQRP